MKRIHKFDTSPQHGRYFTRWLDTNTARSHTLGTKLQDVIEDQLGNEVTTISIRGREGTGKTTLARDIAHILHERLAAIRYDPAKHDDYVKKHIKRIQDGYIVRLLQAEDLLNFRETLEAMPPRNRILIFDDLSYVDKLKNMKAEATKVRHIVGKDVKVILIYLFHYSRALDKFLRDTLCIYQTSISGEEVENLKDAFKGHKRNANLVNRFMKHYFQFRKQRHITLNLARQTDTPVMVRYQYSNPYRLGMYYNGQTASYFVFPGTDRLGVDACTVCNHAAVSRTIPPDRLVQWLRNNYADKKEIGEAMRLFSYQTLRQDIRYDGQSYGNYVLDIINRLYGNGIITDPQALLASYYGIEQYNKHQPHIRKEMQQSFRETFGADGLAAPGPAKKKKKRNPAVLNSKQAKADQP